TKSNSGPITEVTDELSARSCDPPHPYTKNAPTAQKFSDQRCKRTFATVSATNRLMHRSNRPGREYGREWCPCRTTAQTTNRSGAASARPRRLNQGCEKY